MKNITQLCSFPFDSPLLGFYVISTSKPEIHDLGDCLLFAPRSGSVILLSLTGARCRRVLEGQGDSGTGSATIYMLSRSTEEYIKVLQGCQKALSVLWRRVYLNPQNV